MYELKKVEHFKKNYCAKLVQPANGWPHDIRAGLEYINANLFDTKFSIAEMKRECMITDQNFSSRFHNYVGFTPRDYIKRHRIRLVKFLMDQKSLTRFPLNTLGFVAGYEKPSTFAMIFKKETGFSPSAWKKNMISGDI